MVRSPNDIIQKIEEMLDNIHTTTKQLANNSIVPETPRNVSLKILESWFQEPLSKYFVITLQTFLLLLEFLLKPLYLCRGCSIFSMRFTFWIERFLGRWIWNIFSQGEVKLKQRCKLTSFFLISICKSTFFTSCLSLIQNKTGGEGSVFIKGDVTWDDSQQPAIFSPIQRCKPFETIERLRFDGYSEHTFVPREIYPFKERITWLKSPFFSWQAIWALKCVRQRFNESLKISKFTRICMKYHSSVAGWQEFSRGRCNRFFWDIRLKIYRLLNFNMLFHFLRTEFSKSKLFSCSQKFDHVTNYCKKPIRFLRDVFGCCHLEILLPWQRDETTIPFPLHDSRFISTAFVCWLVSEPCRLESKEIRI